MSYIAMNHQEVAIIYYNLSYMHFFVKFKAHCVTCLQQHIASTELLLSLKTYHFLGLVSCSWWIIGDWTGFEPLPTGQRQMVLSGIMILWMPADVAKIVYSTSILIIFQMCQRLDMYRDELNALFDKNKEWKPDLVQDQ